MNALCIACYSQLGITELINADYKPEAFNLYIIFPCLFLQLSHSSGKSSGSSMLPMSELPSLFSIYMLDAVIVKVRMSLDDHFHKAISEDWNKEMDIGVELLKSTLKLIRTYNNYIK